MAGAYIPGITVRAIVLKILFIYYGYPVACLLQIISGAQPDYAAADDDDLFHVFKNTYGS
jgi:hypothetical protein